MRWPHAARGSWSAGAGRLSCRGWPRNWAAKRSSRISPCPRMSTAWPPQRSRPASRCSSPTRACRPAGCSPSFLAARGRWHACRQSAGADRSGPRPFAADGGARPGAPRVRLLAAGQGRGPAVLDLLGHQVRAARVRAGAASGSARQRRRRLCRHAWLHPRRRHVRGDGLQVAAGVGTKSPGMWPARSSRRSSTTGPSSTWRRSGCAPGAAIASVAPGFAERASRLLGSHRIAAGVTARQRDQR